MRRVSAAFAFGSSRSWRDCSIAREILQTPHELADRETSVIEDRLEAVGGTLAIESAPQQGAHLRASAPLET